MEAIPHAELIGRPVFDLDTPALLLDIAAMQRNLQRMMLFLSGKGVRLRPHVKLYRATPELVRRQLDAGAIGMTCAKLSEAEVLAAAGVQDILIANQIVGPIKIERLIKLAQISDIKVAVDSRQNVIELAQAAQTRGIRLGVLVEVNIGHNRCGVAPLQPTLDLVRLILEQPGLKFMGLMGYDGHCTMKVAESDRRSVSLQANRLLVETKQFVADAGIESEIVSGAGTFTYRYACEVAGITEVQAGTFLLMDTAFQEHGVSEFEPTLTVLATVISRPGYAGAEQLAIIDTGRKSISPQMGLPEVKRPAAAWVRSLSDEHGRVILEAAAEQVKVGDKIELWVRDANATINQFDRFYIIREGLVEDVWPIPLCGQNT